MNKIVRVIKSKIKKGVKRLLVEIYEGDIQEHTALTLPGIDVIPLNVDKALLCPTNKDSKDVVFGIPLISDIPDGEIKIKGRDPDGVVKGFLYINGEGDVQIGLTNFQAVITESFKTLYDNHTHIVDISKLIALPPELKIPTSAISKKVKVE